MLTVRARPGAARPGISREGTGVRVSVRERAVDGRANEAVRRAVAAWLGIAPSRVTLVRGASGRTKQLALEGVSAAELAAALAGLD